MATLALDDGTLWYEETGEGAALVCVHGGWMDAEAWRPQVEHFADDYRVITMDLRGHGDTGVTDRRRYSVDLLVDDLERLLAHLDVDRPILCGLSLGAMVVQSYLDSHPDGAAGAVIAGPVRSMPPIDLPRGLKSVVSPLPAIAATASTVGTTATFRSLLCSIRSTTGRPWLSVEPSVRSQAVDTVGDVSPDEYRKIFGALYEFEPPDLSRVETPALVVYGDHESPLVKRQGEQLAATVARGTRREIADAGHLVNLDSPAAFNAACAEFFAGLDPVETSTSAS